MIKYGVFFFLLILSLPTAAAVDSTLEGDFDQVLINSKDWRDVYHGILFARLIGKPVDIILTPQAGEVVVNTLPSSHPRVLLIETQGQQQYLGVEALLNNRDFNVVKVPGSGSYGIRLAETLDIDKVFIMDERYPYNAISLGPYALQQEGFVLFVDANTIDETDDYISESGVSPTLYGILDVSVKERLDAYSPTIINKGGKFDDNLHVARKFLEGANHGQVVISNGEFLEIELVNADAPVVFIGSTNVPDQVVDFFETTRVTSAVVVGNYLVDLTRQILRRVENNEDNISLYVRFARTPRQIDDQFTQPQALEYFILPIINPQLEISNIAYNRLTQQLEVTYLNPSEITTFFLSSIDLQLDGEPLTVGDESAETIVSGQLKTLLYDVNFDATSVAAIVNSRFGDYPRSLEYKLDEEFKDVNIISVADESQLTIQRAIYDRADKAFYITLHNPGEVTTHTNVELIDVIIDGVPTTIGTKKTTSLEPGETREVYIRAALSNLDIIENEEILAKAYFGQRPTILFKTTQADLILEVRLIRTGYIVAASAVLIIILLIIVFFVSRKREYECRGCRHQVKSRKKPSRHSCGEVYRKVRK